MVALRFRLFSMTSSIKTSRFCCNGRPQSRKGEAPASSISRKRRLEDNNTASTLTARTEPSKNSQTSPLFNKATLITPSLRYPFCCRSPFPSSRLGKPSRMSTATPPPSGPPSHDTMRARILTHMNADHHFSLVLYSRHYSHLPLSHARTAHLSDITLSHMTITTSFGRCLVPFSPPLTSLAEARARVVAMHDVALRALDVEDLLVDHYIAPNRWWQWLFAGLCLATFTTFPFRARLHPDSNSSISKFWSVGGLVPQQAALAWTLQPVLLPLVILIHVCEATHFARTRLRRYQVEMFSGVWWAWMVDCFVEGVGAIVRFDEVARGVRDEKAKGKPAGRH